MASSQRGKPVQILSINDDYSWRLEYDELSRILLHESIKDKPVVVVSIAGAYRQGKSFLMNFFMRYMRNEGTDNWLGDPRLPLEGFEWKHGSRRLTTGILLWDEVFLATTSDGQEVAVLFMDTQGLFDGESTNEESATLFALSVLTSSVQIYNILHNIRDDQLEHLEFFTQYGQLAQKEVKGCPFQRLVILVRDSNKGTYGAEAGQALLEERLECTKHSRPENQRLRRSIRAHFPDMECFLMPYPGNEVAAGESYDGRLSVVDKKFRKHLRELVPWILAPERLVVKQMNGEKVSCKELLTYIKAYVQAFKSGKLPEPKSLLQATAEANHLTAKDKAAKAYMTMMSNLPRGDLEKLQGMHAEALAKAKKVFDDTPKIGGDQMSKAYLDRLTNELQGNFNRLYDEEQAWLQEQQEIENRRLAKEAEKDKKKRMEFVKKLKETKAWAEKKWKKEKEKCEERLKHEFESKLSKANRESKQKQAQLEAAQKEKEELEKKNKRLLIATVATGIFCSATMGATSFAATAGGAAAKVASVVKVAAPMAVTLATNIATSSNKK